MNEEDKKRVYRDIRLSIHDLEQIVMSLNETKALFFRTGVQDRYEQLSVLCTKVKLQILAEKRFINENTKNTRL